MSERGSIYRFVKPEEQKSKHPLSFLNKDYCSLTKWKNEAREKISELLHYSPEKCALDPETVEIIEMGEYTQEKVYFSSSPEIRIPAYVLIPKKTELPAPGVVDLHDHGGMYYWGKDKLVATEKENPLLREFRKKHYSGESVAIGLVRRGYVVVVIDAFYFGERRLELDFTSKECAVQFNNLEKGSSEWIKLSNDIAREKENLVAKNIFLTGLTWPGILFWDDMRTVDYLISRSEVDPERIGCIGLSIGGYRAAHLAGLDSRIKVSSVIGWMCTYGTLLGNYLENHTWMIYIPGLYKYLDLPDVASLTAPNALLCINGSQDRLFPLQGVKKAYERIRGVYSKIGAHEKFKGMIFDAPHEFNILMQKVAFEWIDKWI